MRGCYFILSFLMFCCNSVYLGAQSKKTAPLSPLTLTKIGDSLLVFENIKGSREIFLRALNAAETAKDETLTIALLNRLARTSSALRDSVAAKKYLMQAEKKSVAHTDLLWRQGHILASWAVYYSTFGPDSLATKSFEKSVSNLVACCEKDMAGLGDLYLDFAKFLAKIQDPRAETMAIRSVQCLQSDFDLSKIKMADAYNLCGHLARRRGETELRNKYLEAAEQILNSFVRLPFNLAIEIYFNLAVQKADQNQFLDALNLFRKIEHMEIIQHGPNAKNLYIYRAMIGSCQVDLKQPQARETLHKAEKLLKRYPDPNQRHLGFIHHRLGRHYLNQNQTDSAVLYFNLALSEYGTVPDSNFISETYIDLAQMHLRLERPTLALDDVDHALVFAGYKQEEVFDPSLLDEANIDRFFNPLELKGRLLHEVFKQTDDEKYLHESLKIFGQIEQLAEYTRNGSYTEDTKRIVSEHFHRGATGALQTLVTLNQRSPRIEYVASAFNFIEHNRYAQLFQDISRSRVFSSLGLADSISHKFSWYHAELERLQYKLAETMENPQMHVNLSDQLIKTQLLFQAFKDTVRRTHPSEYVVRYDSMYALQEIQQKMSPATQLFEFFWSDDVVALVAVTKDTAILATIDGTRINASLDRLLPWLVSSYPPDSLAMSYGSYADLSYRLYLELIASYLDPDCKRLIISADNKLALLPFDALITVKEHGPFNFSNAPYLIRNKEIQYTYTSNLLFKNTARKKDRKLRLLALAYSENGDFPTEYFENEFTEIPQSANEIDEIGNYFRKSNRKLLHGKYASKQAFLNLAPDFDIVHLAIHGVADTTANLNSRLIFNPGTDGNGENELYAHELYNMSASQVRLAVLSACETGVGKNYTGEGMFSMARGFTYAGIPSTVMSLWKVNDESTNMLMNHFYKKLVRGQSISKSLQAAKIAYLDQVDPHSAKPYYWAGFLVLGDSTPILAWNNSFCYFIIFSIMAVTIFVFLGFVKRQKVDSASN